MRYVVAFSLLVGGYLLGTLELPTHAQSSGYYYGSDANGNSTFGTLHQTIPGGPSFYYGMDGSMGTIPAPVPPASSFRSPC